jgi:hypothetical protein
MMKKLMVLSLVLAVVSLASAGLVVTADPSVAAVSGPALAYNGWLTVDPGMLVDVQITAAGGFGKGAAFGAGAMWADYGDGKLWSDFTVANSVAGESVLAGNHILITLTGGKIWTAERPQVVGQSIGLWAENGETLLGTLYVVPEPMTMGLLSLGALFLRRRK